MLDALYGRITWIAARRAMAAENPKNSINPFWTLSLTWILIRRPLVTRAGGLGAS
jgi:hypothetical protein